ncbi:MAG: DUF2029 domain-containing protein [Gemmataceae bacterium]|nr:DUF2029 domain-containing protein [Gemmataceae bacterium]
MSWTEIAAPVLLVKVALHVVQFATCGAVAVLLWRGRINARWAWVMTFAGFGIFVLDQCAHPPGGCDTKHFYTAGCDVRDGEDPYRNVTCLNPPTALPLYGLLARLSFEEAVTVSAVFNVLALAVLLVLAQAALRSSDDEWRLPLHVLGLLTATLALSVSCRYGMDVGQVSVLVTLALLLALIAQRRWPWLAGTALAVATIKPATMLPFLLLFHRRTDRKAWLGLIVVAAALTLLATPIGELPTRLGECLANINHMSNPGGMNNYVHPINADLIGLDRALHFAGVGDRTTVRVTQYAILLALGAWVAWRVLGPNALPRAAACSLVAFYAALFLYHRLYDLPLLVIPLVYGVGRVCTTEGLARRLYAGSSLAILAVLYLRLETVKHLSALPDGGGRLLAALVIPYGVWCVLAGMACLAVAERCRPQKAPVVASAPLPMAA